MVDSREKGARAETLVKDKLKSLTKLPWERTPGSGALNPKHMLKGDLYVPNRTNHYCVEVKHYAEDHLSSKILTAKSPQLLEWWAQTVRQGEQVNRKPLLLFKYDRSSVFAAFTEIPDRDFRYFFVHCPPLPSFWVSTLEDYITNQEPVFVT